MTEDDYGGFDSAGMAMNPYGANYTDRNMMYKAFIKPFTDVFGVTAGKAKEVSRSAQTLGQVAFQSLGTSLISSLEPNYQKIFADASKDMKVIRTEYQDVYDATWDAFKDNDIITAAFMYDPGAVMTSKLARSSASTVGKLLSVISGGTLDSFLQNVSSRFGSKDKKKKNYDMGPSAAAFDTWAESVVNLREAEDEEAEKPKKNAADFLTNPKVIGKALSSTKAKKMQAAAQKVVRGFLAKIYEEAKAVQSVTSLDQMRTIMHVDITKGIQDINKMPAEQKKAAEDKMLPALKSSAKAFYVKQLQAIIQGVVKAGLPESSKFIKDANIVLQKIQAL